jgi:hypothetical protein
MKKILICLTLLFLVSVGYSAITLTGTNYTASQVLNKTLQTHAIAQITIKYQTSNSTHNIVSVTSTTPTLFSGGIHVINRTWYNDIDNGGYFIISRDSTTITTDGRRVHEGAEIFEDVDQSDFYCIAEPGIASIDIHYNKITISGH